MKTQAQWQVLQEALHEARVVGLRRQGDPDFDEFGKARRGLLLR